MKIKDGSLWTTGGYHQTLIPKTLDPVVDRLIRYVCMYQR